jgi:hypothetical protein
MRVGVFTSVSSNIADLAAVTVPNKFEYCMRHGYSLIVDNMPYEQAVRSTDTLCHYLDRFDLLWCLDSDAVITDMAKPVHQLESLGPHMTVCEEGIVEWNKLNCGSTIWRNTPESRDLLRAIAGSFYEWRHMACGWQTWLQFVAKKHPALVTVAPLRSFNSCVWNRPGGGDGPAGSHWQPGDFVYHPCGVFPMEERISWIQQTLSQVVR